MANAASKTVSIFFIGANLIKIPTPTKRQVERCRPVNAWHDALDSNSIQKQSRILGMSRTAHYYKPKGKSKKNLQIRQGTYRIPSQGRSNGCIIA